MTLISPPDNLFRYSPFKPSDDVSSLVLPELAEIQAQYSVPNLDEYAAGQDRMVDSLKERRWWTMKDSEPFIEDDSLLGTARISGKGKQRETPAQDFRPEPPRPAPEIWSQAGLEDETDIAGPSRVPVFRPMRTWDSISPSISKTDPFLSEAGPRTFEAVITLSEPPLVLPKLKNRGVTPAPIDSSDVLRLIVSATLGTTTTDSLEWDSRQARFVYGRKGDRAEALSRSVTDSLTATVLEVPTAIRRLEILLAEQTKTSQTPTHHALFHAVSVYLSFIKKRLAAAIEARGQDGEDGWIKWQATLRDVGDLLKTLCETMYWPLPDHTPGPMPQRAASVLTHLYSLLLGHHAVSPVASSSTLCLAYLLQLSSAPFLSLLSAWVGVSDLPIEVESESSQPWSDLGITRKPKPITAGGHSGEVEYEYEFVSRRMPSFVPKDMRRTLFEAGKSLRLLREADGGHALARGGWGLSVGWGWGAALASAKHDAERHVRRVNREIELRSASLRTGQTSLGSSSSLSRLAKQPRTSRRQIPTEFRQELAATEASSRLSEPALQDDNDETRLRQFLDLLDAPPGSLPPSTADTLWRPQLSDPLERFLSYHATHPLLPPDHPTFPLYVANHLLHPLTVHCDLVSTALVRLYLADLGYLDHLDILRAFWLAGDVGFSERVGAALFGAGGGGRGEAGMGRRARTRARLGLGSTAGAAAEQATADDREWGIALGVGLSDRQRWPPGGAELAYALRTTLLDENERSPRAGEAWAEVEDRVSFAIRPLPEEEGARRAKWMDPQAVEALDFLYLSYTPPSSIRTILTPSILGKYQAIHNFLLRLNRVEAVIRGLYSDAFMPSDALADATKTGVDMPLDRPSSRITSRPGVSTRQTMLSARPQLEQTVWRLRFRMSHFVAALVRYVVDVAIGVNWDRMRRRLERLKRSMSGERPEVAGAEDVEAGRSAYDDNSISSVLAHQDSDEDYDPDIDLVDEVDGRADSAYQLKSSRALVEYHHLTLDRIMRACLLGTKSSSAGHDVAHKILMRLLSAVLDLGKVVREVEGRMVALEEAEERVGVIEKEWNEKEKVFMHALDRLSQRIGHSDRAAAETAGVPDGSTDKDMEALLDGEKQEEVWNVEGYNGLQELVVRLKFQHGVEGVRRGRWVEGA